ncbi:MAG: FKBP-type peptidyl-prolyl cis-trans isomerase [Bacteroidota bacterium]|nr:FKBP-type peptidyl-prolyl cis-trans isomerase [Bacteroidota bacterium]
MRFYIGFIAALGVAAFGACQNNNLEKTASGIEYKIYEDKDGPTPKTGDVVKFHAAFVTDKDSVMQSTYDRGQPEMLKLDSPYIGTFMEPLMLLSEGDSGVFYFVADSLAGGQPLPAFLKSGSKVAFKIKLVDIMTEEEVTQERNKQLQLAVEQYQSQLLQNMTTMKPEIEKDYAAIDAYIKKNNLTAQKDEYGVYYVVEEKGTGRPVKPGAEVRIDYTGRLLSTGKIFDTSNEKAAQDAGIATPGRPYDPIAFPVGVGKVIPGWDLGLLHFNEGGKGKIIIPSALAYGKQGAGEDIPADAILVFDVEVVEVK